MPTDVTAPAPAHMSAIPAVDATRRPTAPLTHRANSPPTRHLELPPRSPEKSLPHAPKRGTAKTGASHPPTTPKSMHASAQTPCPPTVSDNNSITSSKIFTPMHVARFSKLLADHPDPAFSDYVVNGLTYGFKVGYQGQRESLTAPNLASAHANADHISTHLEKCTLDGQTAGPFDTPPFPIMQCSGLGVVPKKNGRLRVIHHLSAPPGQSVNDHISTTDYSLRYVRVDDAIQSILAKGRGALLTKLDIRNAFRLIPVHPSDWPLLGISWNGQFYYERVLPFGLRSSPFIFDRVASAIEWIIRNHFSISDLLHYLDDFLCVSPGHKVLATKQRDIIVNAFQLLQVPLAEEKLEGPSTVITFLGITLDTVRMEARLPEDKLVELRSLLGQYNSARSISSAKLASFLGKLSFASSVIIPGRTFTRRLWDLAKRFHKVPHYYKIVLTSECRKDIQWWDTLIQGWNGKSFFLSQNLTPSTELGLFTDASGAIGWGAYYGREHRWIQGQWATDVEHLSIEFKELYALLAACLAWGSRWSKLRITIHCDNKAVVDSIASGTSKSPTVMSLLRKLFMICAQHNFTVTACHVPGKCNLIADSLSRFKMQEFRRLAPKAQAKPDIVDLSYLLA